MSHRSIEDSFYYNSMLAHGLAQFMPYEGTTLFNYIIYQR